MTRRRVRHLLAPDKWEAALKALARRSAGGRTIGPEGPGVPGPQRRPGTLRSRSGATSAMREKSRSTWRTSRSWRMAEVAIRQSIEDRTVRPERRSVR